MYASTEGSGEPMYILARLCISCISPCADPEEGGGTGGLDPLKITKNRVS